MLEGRPKVQHGVVPRRGTARRIGATLVLAAAATGVLVAAGIALGANSTVGFSFRCSGQPASNQCPKATPATGKLSLLTQPDPLASAKRIQFLFDNDFRFRPWEAPKCNPNQLAFTDMAQAMANCGSSLVGTGRANFFNPGGGSALPYCVLLFNGTNDAASGDPRIVFYLRRFDPQVEPVNCANPASNHGGDGTRFVPALLRTTPVGDYRTKLDFPLGIGPVPLARLDFTLQKDTATSGYVKARCFDADHLWNISTKFTYRDNTTQTVNSTKTCRLG
jgi:hypothetical protein